MVDPKQMFECLHCGQVYYTYSLEECDLLESSSCCCECGGVIQWVGPADKEWACSDDLLDEDALLWNRKEIES